MNENVSISTEQLTLPVDESSRDFVYMGLDIETTASLSHGELIQIGLYIDEDHHYVSDVGHRGNFYWEPKAFEVNGFSMQRIYDGPPVHQIDAALDAFITKVKKDFGVNGWEIIPVGLNVGAFDIPYVRKTFPLFYSGLGYRSLDLNAIFAFHSFASADFKQMKEQVKANAAEAISVASDLNSHNALYDAELAVRMLQKLWFIFDMTA